MGDTVIAIETIAVTVKEKHKHERLSFSEYDIIHTIELPKYPINIDTKSFLYMLMVNFIKH